MIRIICPFNIIKIIQRGSILGSKKRSTYTPVNKEVPGTTFDNVWQAKNHRLIKLSTTCGLLTKKVTVSVVSNARMLSLTFSWFINVLLQSNIQSNSSIFGVISEQRPSQISLTYCLYKDKIEFKLITEICMYFCNSTDITLSLTYNM